MLVRNKDKYAFTQLVNESAYLSQAITRLATVAEIQDEMAAKKKNLKKFLQDFDLVLIDQRINLLKAAKELGGGMHLVMRKRKFPFPVKLSGKEFGVRDVEKSIEQTIESSSYMLLGGGKEFSFPIARTEDLSIKDGVKNVMQGLLRAVSLIVFAQN